MKKYIYIIIGIILLIGIAYYIGNSIGKKNQDDIRVKKEIQIVQIDTKKNEKKVDSLNKIISKLEKKDQGFKKQEIKIQDKIKTIFIEKPENKDCEGLYNKASEKIDLLEKVITVKDSVEYNLRNTIEEQDKIISLKDNIIKNKDKEIELNKSLNKKRDKKYSISLHLGTGGAITKNNNNLNIQYVPVYVGVGISRHIFSF